MQPAPYPLFDIRQQIVGLNTPIARRNGSSGWAIHLDHAAGTPALHSAQAAVEQLLGWCGGAGLTTQAARVAYEQARASVGRFFCARPGQHQVVFTPNATAALALLARRIGLRPGQVIISSELEHQANDLPWHAQAPVLHVRTHADGSLDEDHLAALLRTYAGRVRLLTVSGGSHVTGYLPNLPRLAALAHAAGAEIAVDAAQLAARRAIDLGDLGDPAHLDYLAISGHKLYAPYGCGALIGRAETLARAEDEGGAPNMLGAVALAAALAAIDTIGMDAIAAHEAALLAQVLPRLRAVPGLRLYGDEGQPGDRLGILAFSLDGRDPQHVAAILGAEYGIAVGHGSFGGEPYLRRLIDGYRQGDAGLLRASLGIYTAGYELDLLADALATVASGAFDQTDYRDSHSGTYRPRGDLDRSVAVEFTLAPGLCRAAEQPASDGPCE
ncbi:MAG: aminotransferase class V-fold PLP-dependent enzyme [Oscillochloris sp.]|nr:aminotransferase class V-fold PLP-dependent enzyme [Oscillochloris sp.]